MDISRTDPGQTERWPLIFLDDIGMQPDCTSVYGIHFSRGLHRISRGDVKYQNLSRFRYFLT
jgi:hypothetical protein